MPSASIGETQRRSRALWAAAWMMSVTGCSAAPSQNILGSYFPSWMICALAGLGGRRRRSAGARQAGIETVLRVPLVVYSDARCRIGLRCVADMAGLGHRPCMEAAMTSAPVWLGRMIALLAVAAALGLGAYTIIRLDRQPRTHDALSLRRQRWTGARCQRPHRGAAGSRQPARDPGRNAGRDRSRAFCIAGPPSPCAGPRPCKRKST